MAGETKRKKTTIEEALDRLPELRQQFQQDRDKVERSKGEAEAVRRSMEEKFGVRTLKEANKKLAELQEEKEQIEEDLIKLLEKIESFL